jgi:hypothetical protein
MEEEMKKLTLNCEKNRLEAEHYKTELKKLE